MMLPARDNQNWTAFTIDKGHSTKSRESCHDLEALTHVVNYG